MSNLELVLNMLSETSTTELSKKQKPKTFHEIKVLPEKVEPLQEMQEKT